MAPALQDGPCPRKWSGGGPMGSFGHRKCSGGGWAGSFGRRKWSGGGPMGSFGPSAALLERTGLGGSGGFHLGVGFIRAAVGSRGGVVARLVKSMPPTGGGSGGVLGPGNCGGGVSGTSLSHLGATVSRRSSVECPSQGPVGMAGGCTVGGRLGGYLSLGGATGVGPCVGAGWRGFAGQLRGLDLEDSCAWLGAAGPGTGSEGECGGP